MTELIARWVPVCVVKVPISDLPLSLRVDEAPIAFGCALILVPFVSGGSAFDLEPGYLRVLGLYLSPYYHLFCSVTNSSTLGVSSAYIEEATENDKAFAAAPPH